MARPPAAAEVENYRHDAAKRINIPTAENQSLVPDDDKALKVLRYPRNPDLDPQLVWRGKDAEDGSALEVPTPPIYIQEKIHPRALIENLRKQSAERKSQKAAQIDLFHDFNGLPEGWIEDAAESYYHDEGRWQNRMILGDSLLVMGSLAEREALRGKVQCLYFDPPYGIKFNSNWQPTTNSRDVKDGKEDSVSREPEVVRAFRDTWKDGIHSYLSYLRDRLTVARDLLSETGSVFVQIGDENVHLVRGVMDEIFRTENFAGHIVFLKTSGAGSPAIGTNVLASVADHIIWFAKNLSSVRYRQIYDLKGDDFTAGGQYSKIELPDYLRRPMTPEEKREPSKRPPRARVYRHDTLTSQSGGETTSFVWQEQGRRLGPGKGFWKTNLVGMERLSKSWRLGVAESLSANITFECIAFAA